MTTTTDAAAPITPKHGYTRDRHPGLRHRHRLLRQDRHGRTADQRRGRAAGSRYSSAPCGAAYVFAAIALISLPDNIHSTQLLILWISSSFLQLVLLPIIIVGQNIQSRAADARATKTFEDVEDARNKIE